MLAGTISLLLTTTALAKPYSTSIVVDTEEDLQSLYVDGVLDESDLETLTELLEDPLDLNRARRNEMYDLPGVTLSVAKAIAADRRQNGPFADMADLLRVEGMTEAIWEQITTFSEVQPPPAKVGDLLRGKVRVRSIASFDPVEVPTSTTASWSPAELGYDKWPDTYVSARVEYQRQVKAGILGLAREGLTAVEYNPDRQTIYGEYQVPMVEFGKAYVSTERNKVEAVLGSFTTGFGLGLTFDNTNRTHPHGLYEDLTVSGTDSLSVRKGLMGAGGRFFNLALSDDLVFDGTVFVSSWKYDAYQYSLGVWDGSELNPLEEDLSTPTVRLWEDGEWVRGQYLTIPNAYREDVFGGNATFRLGDQAHLGLTGYVGHLDMTVLDGVSDQYQLVQLADWPIVPWYGATGLNAAWTLGLVEVFGEFAHTFSGETASGNGALLKAIGDVTIGELEGSLRYYGTGFDNPHARGLANADEYGGMRDRDEQGARLKGTLDPLGWMTTRFMADLWRRPSMNGVTNLELYGRVEVRPVGEVSLTAFGDYKNRDLKKNGRGYEYGGETWAEQYGDDYAGEDYTEYDPEDEDAYQAYVDYEGSAGSKFYLGTQVKTTYIPRTTVWALYKRTYEDSGYLYPISTEECCETDFQVGHYWWVKAKVTPLASMALTLRFRYEDEDVKGDQGVRYWESYLQVDQKLPKRTKLSVRGTLGKNMEDPQSWWEGWCSQDCELSESESCTGPEEDVAEDLSIVALYGQIKATFEWRF